MATPTANSVPATSVSTAGLSNDLASLVSGLKWGAGGYGSGATLTYSFPLESLENAWFKSGYGSDDEELGGIYALDAAQRTRVEQVIDHFEESANLVFVKLADSEDTVGEIRFTGSFTQASYAHAYYPFNAPEAGDIWFSEDWDAFAPDPGTWEWMTIVHELGHAVGLRHPFGGSVNLPEAKDNHQWTVMAYDTIYDNNSTGDGRTWATIYPTTLMYNDLLALEKMYGKSTVANLGNTTYTYSQGSAYRETINDSGGVDTIVYNGANASKIDLAFGHWSHLGNPITFGNGLVLKETVCIGPSAKIENATGGSGADTLLGNGQNNKLTGNAGADILKGLGGADTFFGGAGNDKVTGGAGNDKFVFNAALVSNKDTIFDFAAGADKIQLDDDIFTALGSGAGARNLQAANFRNGAAVDANDFILYNAATGDLSYDADGSGAGAAVAFAKIGATTHPALTAADFQIIA